jgi:hypothetical protein
MFNLLDDARARALIVTVAVLGNPGELHGMCRDAAQLSRAGRLRMINKFEAELRHRQSLMATRKAPRRSKPAAKRKRAA